VKFSLFAIDGCSDKLPEIDRMDSILRYMHDVVGAEAAQFVVVGQRGVSDMAAYRCEVLGYKVHLKEEGLLDDVPRMLVIVTDSMEDRHATLLEEALKIGVAAYVLPLG
jgi:hypothetical protein